jgi:hypothetical protein
MNTQFSEEVQIAYTYMRKNFNMLSHAGEAYQYYNEILFTPVTMVIAQKTKSNKCFSRYEEKEPSYNVTGNVNKCQAHTFTGNFNK